MLTKKLLMSVIVDSMVDFIRPKLSTIVDDKFYCNLMNHVNNSLNHNIPNRDLKISVDDIGINTNTSPVIAEKEKLTSVIDDISRNIKKSKWLRDALLIGRFNDFCRVSGDKIYGINESYINVYGDYLFNTIGMNLGKLISCISRFYGIQSRTVNDFTVKFDQTGTYHLNAFGYTIFLESSNGNILLSFNKIPKNLSKCSWDNIYHDVFSVMSCHFSNLSVKHMANGSQVMLISLNDDHKIYQHKSKIIDSTFDYKISALESTLFDIESDLRKKNLEISELNDKKRIALEDIETLKKAKILIL